MRHNGGPPNLDGINFQIRAAFSLFLQYLKDEKFSHIHLEAPQFQDFNLLFSNGKKIICECKKRKKKFSYPDLKKILENIQEGVNENDEILIICEKVNEQLMRDINNVKCFIEAEKKFKKKGYSEKITSYLSSVKFWIVPGDFHKEIIYPLLAEIIGFWLPFEDVEKIAHNILVKKFYLGSAESAVYTREDFLSEVNKLAVEVKQNNVFYNREYSKLEEQFLELEAILENPGHPALKAKHELSALSAQMDLLYFVIENLKNKNEIDLSKWEAIWELNKFTYLMFGIFDIFIKNLHSEENKKYVIDYCKKNIQGMQSYYRIGYLSMFIRNLISKIIEEDTKGNYLEDEFFMVKELMANEKNEFFYLKINDCYKKGALNDESGKFLCKIYQRADAKLRGEIFNYIVSNYNLTKDDGQFSCYIPKNIYEIVRDHVEEDFDNRFLKFVKIISEQYDNTYKEFGKNVRFSGWELYGLSANYINSNILDRHFIQFVLFPAIKSYYLANKDEAWQFIKKFCVFIEESVSEEKPDFLNRAIYKIVLDRYLNENAQMSEESFEILQEYILSSNGIPLKSDLIYSELSKRETSFEKKWKLVDIYLQENVIPDNVFIEKIIADCAKKGFKEAKDTLKNWYLNPEYYRKSRYSQDYVSNIEDILENDIYLATELLNLLILSEYVCLEKGDNLDGYNAYSVANLLNKFFKRNYDGALSVFRLLEKEEKLNNNQQIIYTASLTTKKNENDDDRELLLRVYKDVMVLFLDKYCDIEKIVKRLPNEYCRKEFTNFAEKLAINKCVKEALNIIHIFIDDPDPCAQSEKIENGETPNIFESVRGQCGLALMSCIVLEGREQIPEIIQLTKKLLNDENYYVVYMACYSLWRLTENRLKVLPDNRDKLFFDDEIEKALVMAKEVENMAFNLLDRFISWPLLVQKAMVKEVIRVFNPIRALNEQEALKFITTLSEHLPLEILADFAFLFIYFAELRKYAYEDWKFKEIDLYDKLSSKEFDDEKFKKILVQTIKRIQSDNPSNCFQFASSIEYMMREYEVHNKDIYGEKSINYNALALKYFDLLADEYALNVFNLIYQVIEAKFDSVDATNNLEDWFLLLVKCLSKEKEFYKEKYSRSNGAVDVWDATLHHSKILEGVYKRLGEEKFITAAKIYISLPLEVILHESEKLVLIVIKLAKGAKNLKTDAKLLISALYNRNPSKYFKIKKEAET